MEKSKIFRNHFQTGHVIKFLIELNDSFSQIRTQLFLIESKPTLQKAFSLVQEVEQCASISQFNPYHPSTIYKTLKTCRNTSYCSILCRIMKP